jgi:trigger factor
VTTAEVKDTCKREIEVHVPAEEVARQTEVIVQKFQKLARIPGFRKGKVPATVIRQRFSEDIKSEVVEALVPRYFRRETDKQGLHPVSQPQVTDLHVHEGEALHFKASFEVMPEIQVAGYKELRAEHPEITVTGEEVSHAIDDLREQQAAYIPIEGRTLADGDFAQVALEGKAEDGEGQPVKMDDILVEIGGKNTLEEFSVNLRGVSAGDERSFDVHYPQEYSDQRLAGKHFTYSVKVLGMKQKTMPELNDEFAQAAAPDLKSVDDLRQHVRGQIERSRRVSAEREAKDKLVAELVKRNEFAVPEALIERQVELRLERGLRALAAQGMRPDDLKKMDFDRLRAGQRDQAEQEVKASLLLEKISDAENIQVSDEEVDHEILSLAGQLQQTPDAVRARLTQDGALDRIRHRIRSEKTLEFLYRQSA